MALKTQLNDTSSRNYTDLQQCSWCSQIDFNLISRLFPAETDYENDRWITETGPHPQNKHGRVGYRIADAGRRFRTSVPPQCGFCKLLYNHRAACRWSEAKGQDGDLLLGVSLRRIIWDDASDPLADPREDDTILFVVPSREVQDGMSWSFCRSLWENLGYGICVANKGKQAVLCKLVHPEVNYDYIHSWVADCRQNHPNCQAASSDIDLSLIDCRRKTIVSGHSSSPYLALSYLWGDTKHVALDDGVHIPNDLPAVIADAIGFTLSLGYQFLWVDQLCIDQKDTGKKMKQISQMNLVYSGAEITLVAVAGDDASSGLPGAATRIRPERLVQLPVAVASQSDESIVFCMAPPTKDVIRDSKWATRGWTYQEGFLSRRILVFTNDQVYFECGGMIRLEGLSTEVTTAEFRNGFSDTFQSRVSGPISNMMTRGVTKALGLEDILSTFVNCLNNYGRRDLSYEEDRLNAFAGIINELESRYTDIEVSVPLSPTEPSVETNIPIVVSLRSLWGLPCITSPTTEPVMKYTLQRIFLAQLCWGGSSVPAKLQRNRQFPSWSWLGWKGPGTYFGPSTTSLDITKRDCIFVDEICADFSGYRRPVEETWSDSSSEVSCGSPQVHALYLNVVILHPKAL